MIHESLKRRWGIGKTEMHDQKVERPVSGTEYGFPLVARGNAYEVVGTSKVNFGKDLQAMEAIEEVWDKRKRVLIFLAHCI